MTIIHGMVEARYESKRSLSLSIADNRRQATFFDGQTDGKIPTAVCDRYEIQLLEGAGDHRVGVTIVIYR
jgi:hypothetical protein